MISMSYSDIERPKTFAIAVNSFIKDFNSFRLMLGLHRTMLRMD